MKPLRPDDFSAFFREVNSGHSPFPWQARLASYVCEHGRWPGYLDIPTACGKTAVLEIALFHLALEIQRTSEPNPDGGPRRAPVRIAFVVDRRLIVDQAQRRAERIREALRHAPPDSAAGMVSGLLGRLAEDAADPLVVRALRGGLPREEDWARTPVQPTILLSTVDQTGSRLLFRGYGISKSMRPVHAGLLGSDCMIFIDEAHLSEPFRQTLGWVKHYRKAWVEQEPSPWQVTLLSATPGEDAEGSFRLEEDDQTDPILLSRLGASKIAQLEELPSGDAAAHYARLATEALKAPGIRKVLVVVNRVALARSIFEALKSSGSAFLLTGRVRELDRERIVGELEAALGRDEPVVAVATQCIEAGADYDFDALVTQAASLDALRQRFGRLNRTGRAVEAKAWIVAAKEDLKKPDPVYGLAMLETWKWLTQGKRKAVDFGVEALNALLRQEQPAGVYSQRPDAPVLPPAYLDLWTCTNPGPAMEPDVSFFLHGLEKASADVEIVWRADLDGFHPDNAERLVELLTLAPPQRPEMLAVRLWNAREWLAGRADAADLADAPMDPGDNAPFSKRWVLRWRGPEDPETRLISAEEIRPGDVLVVPAAFGGVDEWGWTGQSGIPGSDLFAEAIDRLKTSQIAVRLHPGLFDGPSWSRIAGLIAEYGESPGDLGDALLSAEHLELPATLQSALREVHSERLEVAPYDEDRRDAGVILTGRRMRTSVRSSEPATEADVSYAAGQEALLSVHTARVTRKAEEFALRAGLPARVIQAIEFAAEQHDAGKADRRFQRYLGNGVSPTGEPLAKSPVRAMGLAERRARAAAGLPERWRHEALSVRAAIEVLPTDGQELDRELALWLIGTHHGWGRPFFPHDDPLDDAARVLSLSSGRRIRLPAASGPQRLDFEWEGNDWAALWETLHRRYGYWELARFEALLRLADHRASEEAEDARARPVGTGA